MSIRTNTDHQLSDLGKMLAVWPQRVRDPSQFWPQFDALAQRILDSAAQADVGRVRRELQRLLHRNGLSRARWTFSTTSSKDRNASGRGRCWLRSEWARFRGAYRGRAPEPLFDAKFSAET
nr:hypothetical protein VDP59_010645 [Xanthomonas campestris pv. campestris]